MSQRFEKAFKVLTEAWFKGELEAGDCRACAVGNLCRTALAERPELRAEGVYNHYWNQFFVTDWISGKQHFRSGRALTETFRSATIEMMETTGYTQEELARIEFAFETNTVYKRGGLGEIIDSVKRTEVNPDEQELLEDQFNGLQAVVNVMVELDNIPNAQCYRDKLREHPGLKPKLTQTESV